MNRKGQRRRLALPVCLLPFMAAGLGGCIHLHEIPPVYLHTLAWGGLSAPPARESGMVWPLAWLLSMGLILAYLGGRLLRARRAALLRVEQGQEIGREELALARTARDAVKPLVRKQLGRWRVVVLEEFRRDGRE